MLRVFFNHRRRRQAEEEEEGVEEVNGSPSEDDEGSQIGEMCNLYLSKMSRYKRYCEKSGVLVVEEVEGHLAEVVVC